MADAFTLDPSGGAKDYWNDARMLSGWLADINGYVKQVFTGSADIDRLFKQTELRVTEIDPDMYLSGVLNQDENGPFSLDLHIVKSDVLPKHGDFAKRKSTLYVSENYTHLLEKHKNIFEAQREKLSSRDINNFLQFYNFFLKLKNQLQNPHIATFAAHPFFIHYFLYGIGLCLDLNAELQRQALEENTDAEKQALESEKTGGLPISDDSSSEAPVPLTQSNKGTREKYEEALKHQGRNIVFEQINDSLQEAGSTTLSPSDIENVDKNLRAYIYEHGKVPTTKEEWSAIFQGSRTSISFETLQASELDKLNGYADHISQNPVFQKLMQYPEETKSLRADFAKVANDFGPHADLAIYHVYGEKSDALQAAQDDGRISLEEADLIRALKQRLVQAELEELKELYRQNNENVPEGELTEEDLNSFRDQVDGEGGILEYLLPSYEEVEQTEEAPDESDDGGSSPSGRGKGKRSTPAPPSPGEQKKKLERVKKSLQTAKTFLSNPVVAGAGLVTGGGLIYAFSQGVATGVGALSAAGGGALIGFAVGGPVGAMVGAALGTIGSLIPINGNSFAHWLGTDVYHIADSGHVVQTAGQIGKAGLSALAKTVPASLPNATSAVGNLVNTGATSLSKLATAGVQGLQSVLPTLNAASSVLGVGPATTLVLAPIGGAAIIAAVITTMDIPGSFLTPDEGLDVGSKYVELTKTADPSQVENTNLPTTISYKINLKPKMDPDTGTPYVITLTNATDKVSLRSRQNPPPATPPAQDVSGLQPNVEFSYSIPLDTSFADTRVTNTITITYDVKKADGTVVSTNETFLTSASVRIGNPPDDIGCFEFSDDVITKETADGTVTTGTWSEGDKNILTEAYSINGQTLGQLSPTYESLLCSSGKKILLYRSTDSVSYGGWTFNPDGIIMFNNGLGSILNTRYTLVHESGHIIVGRSPSTFTDFTSRVFNTTQWLRSYGYYKKDANNNPIVTPREDFPETFAVFFTYQNRKYIHNSTCFNMPSDYPSHYTWISTLLGVNPGPLDSALAACQ